MLAAECPAVESANNADAAPYFILKSTKLTFPAILNDEVKIGAHVSLARVHSSSHRSPISRRNKNTSAPLHSTCVYRDSCNKGKENWRDWKSGQGMNSFHG